MSEKESADSYVWKGKKRSSRSHNGPGPGGLGTEGTGGTGGTEGTGVPSTSCLRRRRERARSCSALGDALTSADRRKALSRRSLRQKFQDAVGQCFPLRSQHQHHPSGPPRPFSALFLSKRKIHISELMQDQSPYSPKPGRAPCWHLLKKHTNDKSAVGEMGAPLKPSVSSSSPSPAHTPLSWDDTCCSPGPDGTALGNWDPHGGAENRCSHTDCILVPDLLQITSSPGYWGVLDRFEAEELLEGKPEGTFLLRDSAQDEFLFSVSFRRIEQNHRRFSFDVRDPCMYQDASVTGLLRHYSDPATCLFFEPLLSRPLSRTFPFSLQNLCRTVICSCSTYQGIESLPLPPQLRDFLRRYHIRCGGFCAVGLSKAGLVDANIG